MAAQDTFPDGFLWGAATAAYQIEGAVREDGRGPSIWDTFSHTPGKVQDGDTGDVACDHYHRWRADIGLMRDLGLRAYRFSIAWPRIFPDGAGAVNTRGLDVYDRLVDELLAANITPFVTLYHWDLPQALQDRGGWTRRDTVDRFAAYTDTVARRLGDRVTHWITHNEPWVAAFLGNYLGIHAPGLRDLPTAVLVAHHILLSHGRAAAALRAAGGGQVGITLNLAPALPASESAADEDAARRMDAHLNRWYLDPLFGRGYPSDLDPQLSVLQGRLADTTLAADLAAIAAPLDFLGINYYAPQIVRATPLADNPLGFAPVTEAELVARGYELTGMGWPVVPDALHDLLLRVQRDYAPPALYITENGAAFPDRVVDGAVNDPQRVAYLAGHLRAASAASAEGVPLRGYFVWSLLDNFEWSFGYSKRFGIVQVDYATQKRLPKTSAAWYQQAIDTNRVPES
ncbi:MAG: GH1 family beta-glucosidase [Thermomicrobiales bacterium]